MHCFFNTSSLPGGSSSSLTLPLFKERPRDLVVFLAVGEGEGGGVAALDLAGAAGEGVVGDGGGGDGAVGEVTGFLELSEFFPTLDRAGAAVWQGEGRAIASKLQRKN